jgi:site-specific DNA-cytosine methylase
MTEPPPNMKVGAMFAGYGGLERAVQDVFPDAHPAWVSEFDAAPSRILAQRFPGVPNLGDVTKVDWAAVEPVDIITGGSPCQDLSHAGKRAGMKAGRIIPAGVMACGCHWAEHEVDSCGAASPSGDVPSRLYEREQHVAAMRAVAALNARDRADGGPPPERRVAGTRSGLWASMCDAIDIIRPRFVVWENVRGALSAAATAGDVETCDFCVGDAGDVHLRALGRVLGDLAELGYDAAWHGLRAADVGAPHGRWRVFVLAWPADTQDVGLERAGETWRGGPTCGPPLTLLLTPTAQLAVNGGSQPPAKRKAGGHGPTLADQIEHL